MIEIDKAIIMTIISNDCYYFYTRTNLVSILWNGGGKATPRSTHKILLGASGLVDACHSAEAFWRVGPGITGFLTGRSMLHLTLLLLNLNIPCLCKQCRSRSVGF